MLVFLFSSAGLSSPNFLHLLPDGFREGKVFVLDVFHRHHPPITVTQTKPLSLLSSPQIKITIMFLKNIFLNASEKSYCIYFILCNIYYLGSFYLVPIHKVLLHIMCSKYKLW